MTLADKRKVIEVLLCSGDVGHQDGTPEVAAALKYHGHINRGAVDAWSPVANEPAYENDWSPAGMAEAYTEAAYRLIESSPTLRREWFGRP